MLRGRKVINMNKSTLGDVMNTALSLKRAELARELKRQRSMMEGLACFVFVAEGVKLIIDDWSLFWFSNVFYGTSYDKFFSEGSRVMGKKFNDSVVIVSTFHYTPGCDTANTPIVPTEEKWVLFIEGRVKQSGKTLLELLSSKEFPEGVLAEWVEKEYA